MNSRSKVINYLYAFEEKDPLKFTSRKDWWLGAVVWAAILLFAWLLFQSIFIHFSVIGIMSMTVMISWLIWIWFRTRYTIKQGNLIIHYGPMKKTINIQEIETIRYTTNPFVAPALSRHKIEINYGNYGFIHISPKDRNAFIHELKRINTHIRMSY